MGKGLGKQAIVSTGLRDSSAEDGKKIYFTQVLTNAGKGDINPLLFRGRLDTVRRDDTRL
jgi:hypothetical protein